MSAMLEYRKLCSWHTSIFLAVFFAGKLPAEEKTQLPPPPIARHAADKDETKVLGPEYDAQFPYYMKFCSTSKYHPYKGKGVAGTKAGHGIYYLKGVCKDPSLGPVGMKLCEASSNFGDPELGVGISVNKFLQNSNFLLIPGRRLFLGLQSLQAGEFNLAFKDKIVKELVDNKVFEGIEFHKDKAPQTLRDEDLQEFIARNAFGTDYAVSLARNLYCINVPLKRQAMGKIVDQLNASNAHHRKSQGEPYRGILCGKAKPDKDYHWDALFDNCVHPAWNALAGLGFFRPKPVNLPLVAQVWNIVVPANTLLAIHKASNLDEIDVEAAYKNPLRRQALLEFDWIAQQAGVIAESIKLYPHNALFKVDENMAILPSLLERRHKMLRSMMSDPRFFYAGQGSTSLQANLRYFHDKYRCALAKLKESKAKRPYIKRLEKGDLRYIDFVDRFQAILEQGLAEIKLEP